MATPPLLSPPKPFASHRPMQTILSLPFPFPSPSPSPSKLPTPAICRVQTLKPIIRGIFQTQTTIAGLVGAGLALTLAEPASAAELSLLGSSLQFNEPANALSLPTWAIHVSSVVEWIIAMALVWQYGEESGFESWKGLSWGMGCLDVPLSGIPFICWLLIAFSYFEIFVLVLLLLLCLSLPMVPLLGGAFCACTWHFFYNSESLEVLVALQAALTVIGNATMCFAAFRIYKSSQEGSKNL